MGTQDLPPGAMLPVHRHLHHHEVLFVAKGQGRATVDGEEMTVVPGMVVDVPPQAWYGLRNTGTGMLQVVWVSAPPGIEAFFRELARLTAPPDAATLQGFAQRFGIEFRPEDATGIFASLSHPQRRRRHRGGRGRGGGPPNQPRTVQPQPAALAPSSSASSPPTSVPMRHPPRSVTKSERPAASRRRHRRRRGGSPRAPQLPSAPPGSMAPLSPTSSAHPPPQTTRGGGGRSATSSPASGPSPAQGRAQRRVGHRHRGRVKEVYMGGRWIQVSGEGPIIASGEPRPREGRQRAPGDKTTP